MCFSDTEPEVQLLIARICYQVTFTMHRLSSADPFDGPRVDEVVSESSSAALSD